MNKYLELQDKLCQAMEMFAENAVNKAGFDRTIQATIISCVDESIGRYKVQYQDSMFYAYAQNDENKYSSGTGVYVLIQNNDMARDKFIIGTVDKLGMDYLSITDESDRYEKIGTNCLNFPNEIQLCSYLKEDSYLINTNSGYIQNNDLLTYIKDAECLLIQMDIQTALDQIQRRKGDYGLEIELIFKNELNENANNIIRKYIVNINQMTGNPYLYIDKTPQLFAISIDNENFLGIKSIKAFSKDFPKEKDEMPKDIFFSNLAVYAANRLDESELNTSRLTIHSPFGLVFSDKIPKLNIEAVARTGNEVTTGMDYYWFVEDASVTSQSDDFLIFGGQGWKCLNFYDIIETEDEEVKEWKPDINTKVFNIDNRLAEQVKYKCVAVKGEEILNKEFTLYNSLAQYKIELISDKGTTFYNGVGSPILTCKVTKDDILFTDCNYVWTYIDKNNILTLMSNIDSKLTVDISSIDDFNIYQCSVYKDNFFVGSAEITLLNKKGTEGTYNLVINNGIQTFVYNEDGVSPASSNIVNPITILPLSFTLFDNNGQPFDDSILATLDFSWKIPAENTLLQTVGGELIDGYYYFRGIDYLQLNYKIASAYSINKTNNQIELNLTYKNLRLKANTNFIFIKEGEIGTNGTGVVAAIQAIGLRDGEEPMTYRFASTTNKNYSNLQFNLFSNEDEGTWLSVSEKATDSNMTWSILRNKYYTSSDLTNLVYTANSGFTQPQYNTSGYPANIIAVEAKYNNKKYFTTLPMITGIINNNSYPYILYLKRGTGFRTVMYASDGTKPKYSTAEPFEVGLRKTDGTEIDISGSEYTFTWTIKGTDDGNSLVTYLTKINTELNKNQFKCRPSEKYDGRSVSIALECSVYRNGSIISKIYIPIYFYLNTYGYDELNDWNGNSIEIDDNGSYILTPQVGAGEKNANNTFTGLLMGKVVDSNKNEKIGLIGLYNGIQTIFLDSKTGRSEFGKAGSGQIILDPSKKEAIIQSGNFNTTAKTGMQINLSNPSIIFGSGNFSIDSAGKLRATGVNLTGTITAEEGYIGGITLHKDYGLYTNNKTSSTSANNGFLIQKNGDIYLGPYSNGHCPIELYAKGELYAINGTIGCWTMTQNQMYSTNAGVNKNSTVGMAFWAGAGGTDHSGNNADFRVEHSGKLYANNAIIKGNIKADKITALDKYYIHDVYDNEIEILTGSGQSAGHDYALTIGYGVNTLIMAPSTRFWTGFDIYAGLENLNAEATYLYITANDPWVSINNNTSNRWVGLHSSSAGNIGLYDRKNSKWIIRNDSDLVTRVQADKHVLIQASGFALRVGQGKQADNDIVCAVNTDNVTEDKDGKIYLGASWSVWHTVYSKNGVKTTSDEREKNIIGKISEKYLQFFMDLDPILYTWKDDEKQNIHFGLGAQTTEKKALKHNISNKEIAAIEHDEWDTPNSKGLMDKYSLNYLELLTLAIPIIQKHEQEINDLKQQVKQLQAKLDNI